MNKLLAGTVSAAGIIIAATACTTGPTIGRASSARAPAPVITKTVTAKPSPVITHTAKPKLVPVITRSATPVSVPAQSSQAPAEPANQDYTPNGNCWTYTAGCSGDAVAGTGTGGPCVTTTAGYFGAAGQAGNYGGGYACIPHAGSSANPTPTQAQPVHAGEIYCTYLRMLTAECTNGGYVMVSDSAYNQALEENPNDPGSILSGWFPLSEVQSQ
jgi:hypothetical protein